MKIPRLSPMRLIRKQCLECCGDSVKTVRFCQATDCPLWFLRFGKHPKTYIRENGKQAGQLFDKDNFQKGGRFCPEEEISSYEVWM